ncbi:MAG: hypothetical protein VB025_14050, partial [Sphaerochaeta sp.]|nr:hypothetical protein [Sphaerochaeta sp.]
FEACILWGNRAVSKIPSIYSFISTSPMILQCEAAAGSGTQQLDKNNLPDDPRGRNLRKNYEKNTNDCI